MTADFNPGSDFPDVADALQPVALHRRGDGTTVQLASALRRAVTDREAAASDGQYTASDVTWHLSAAELPIPPAVGDTITDASSTAWTVLTVRHDAQDTRWRCACRALEIHQSLDESVDLQIADWTKGDAGAAIASWTTIRTDLPARIQPHRIEIETSHGRRTVRTTHRVYVAVPLEVTENHRLVGPDGSVYHVVAADRPDRIDAAMVIHVVRSSWPLG